MTMHSILGRQRTHKVSETPQLCHKTILEKNRYDSLILARCQLHWLQGEERITFKVLTLEYKCLNNQALLYLKQLE